MSGPETDLGRANFEELLWVHSTEERRAGPTMRRIDHLGGS
jgi:hypothetical protein